MNSEKSNVASASRCKEGCKVLWASFFAAYWCVMVIGFALTTYLGIDIYDPGWRFWALAVVSFVLAFLLAGPIDGASHGLAALLRLRRIERVLGNKAAVKIESVSDLMAQSEEQRSGVEALLDFIQSDPIISPVVCRSGKTREDLREAYQQLLVWGCERHGVGASGPSPRLPKAEPQVLNRVLNSAATAGFRPGSRDTPEPPAIPGRFILPEGHRHSALGMASPIEYELQHAPINGSMSPVISLRETQDTPEFVGGVTAQVMLLVRSRYIATLGRPNRH